MVFPAVAMRGVDLSLGRGAARVHILRDVALTIGKGEAVGIVGASGSGKSTLLMIIAGLERPGASDATARAKAELAEVGLGDRLSHYPAQLSGGEQQRVALARALSPRPSLLIADEPTGNLDEATGRAIIDLLFDLPARRGATLALVTHDSALAARCDRVIKMRSGALEETPPVAISV